MHKCTSEGVQAKLHLDFLTWISLEETILTACCRASDNMVSWLHSASDGVTWWRSVGRGEGRREGKGREKGREKGRGKGRGERREGEKVKRGEEGRGEGMRGEREGEKDAIAHYLSQASHPLTF